MPPAPAARSHRDNRQHFHSRRQGSMLVPHGPLSGLLFSVNPRQEGHALREARAYCAALTEDLQRVHLVATQAVASESATTEAAGTPRDATPSTAAISTSDRLAAELASYTTTTTASSASSHNAHKRPRQGSDSDSEDNDDDDDSGEEAEKGATTSSTRGARPNRRQQWFAPLETNCKGYLLLNIPVINPSQTCVVCHAGAAAGDEAATTKATEPIVSLSASDALADAHQAVVEGQGERTEKFGTTEETTAQTVLPPHSIVLNPLVSIVVERVFHDLAAVPRPVFKNCFRLFPVELTCCPTPTEMQKAVQTLLRERFPRLDGTPQAKCTASSTTSTSQDGLSLAQKLPFYEPGAAKDPASGASLVKSMYKITLQFSIKNNTNVEKKKSEVLSALQAAIPANRFILLRGSSANGRNKIKADASLIVAVLHATCVMGIQMHYEDRSEYNVHAIGETALELSNTVTTA